MVQVIPKTTSTPGQNFRKIAPWFSLILVIVVIGLYFWFNYQLIAAREDLHEVSSELSAAQSEADKELETRIKLFKERARDVLDLLKERLLTSVVFDFLEANIHPDVHFNQLTFAQGSRVLELGGTALDYKSLGAQMSVLDNENFVEHVKLNRVSLSPEGNVIFNFEIELIK